MTTENKETIENALKVLIVEHTPVDTVKQEYQSHIAGLRLALHEDILKENHFELDESGNIFSGAAPTEEKSPFEAFLNRNKISILKPERKTLTQLIEDQKQTTWKSIFK